jgi:hypothetical protein
VILLVLIVAFAVTGSKKAPVTAARSSRNKTTTTVASGGTTPSTSPGATQATAPVGNTSNTDPADGEPVPLADMGGAEKSYSIGQTGTLYDTADMVPLATITVSAPQFASSDAAGDTPQYGYFATFSVTVADIAPAPSKDDISPSSADFFVQTSDGSRYGTGVQSNVLGGNSVEATGDTDLGTNSVGGTIDLFPGQTTTGTVEIDVPSQHGSLVYAGRGNIEGAWSF